MIDNDFPTIWRNFSEDGLDRVAVLVYEDALCERLNIFRVAFVRSQLMEAETLKLREDFVTNIETHNNICAS